MNILLIDNYDSFTYNLSHQLQTVLDCHLNIVLHDHIQASQIDTCDAVVISPGPGTPHEYQYDQYLDRLGATPVLGICLGMQILNRYHGGSTDKLENCEHGTTRTMQWQQQQHDVAIYHSLYCNKIADHFHTTATTDTHIPMMIEHQNLPHIGFQFHPESFLTLNGETFIDYAFNQFFRRFN